MAGDLEIDLRELIAKRRVLVIVGSGVSIGATKNAEAASWSGLLKLGVAHCRTVNPSLDDAWEQRLLGEIGSSDIDDTLSAAEKVSRKLQAASGGEFSRWLRETVGALALRDAAVLEALRDLQVPLATTNYDDLLERGAGPRRLGLRPADARREWHPRHVKRGAVRLSAPDLPGISRQPARRARRPGERTGESLRP
jgi:hypothetical protein